MAEVQSPTSTNNNIKLNSSAKVGLQQHQHTNGKDDSELDEEDKRLIRADWDLARKDLQTVATKLFLVFFKQNPTYPEMFRWAKGIDIPSMNIDTPFDSIPKRMHHHALMAAKQISVIVDNLDNPEGLEAVFTTLGQQHVKRNVTPSHWERFNFSVLTLLRTLLTPAGYNDRHEEAWKKEFVGALKFIQALQVITDASLKATEAALKNGEIQNPTTNGGDVSNGNL